MVLYYKHTNLISNNKTKNLMTEVTTKNIKININLAYRSKKL